ncbi:MAG: HAD family hydrolase [Acidobacteria bacterium]|nr:HAD family hydrolase [Acidobacteriota bacterium]
MINAFIFDIDGTLIDSVEAHAKTWVKTFNVFGKKIELAEAKKLIGMGGDQFLSSYFSKDDLEKNEEKIEKYRSDLLMKEYLQQIKPFPKVRELFKKIKGGGKKIVLASSARKEEVEAYKKIAAIEGLIDEETSTDDAEESKPEPDIFQAALQKLKKIEKNHIVVIGDTPYDAIAAKKVDLKIIGVLTGGWTREKLLQTGCSKVYRDIAEIYENYESL